MAGNQLIPNKPQTSGGGSQTDTPQPATSPGQPETQLPSGWTARVYQLSTGEMPALADGLRQYLLQHGYETQVLPQDDKIIIQGRKGGLRSLVGMSLAGTVIIEPVDGSVKVAVGGGQWIDKIGAAAISMVVLWPLLITGGLGAWQQKDMIDSLWKVIDNTMQMRNARRIG